MLAGTLFYVALIALLATTILSAGLLMTRATITRMAQPYLAAGYQHAITALTQTVSGEMQSGGVPYPAPAFTLAPACANASCTYRAAETIVPTQMALPTPGPACDSTQPNCAANVQTNAYVGERRVTATITVNLLDGHGASVAVRSGTVTLRTFSTPPYVALAGTRDGAFDDVANMHAAGDDGGAPPATPDPCASAAQGIADDTTVRVAYQNERTGACSNGSSWGDVSY